MDHKLAVLFVLVGVVIALSHLTDDRVTRMRQQLALRRWRGFRPARRKS